MTAWLKRQGFVVNPKRVRRLLRLMGLEAVYPKKRPKHLTGRGINYAKSDLFGSVAVEKAVDLIVSRRFKLRGMS